MIRFQISSLQKSFIKCEIVWTMKISFTWSPFCVPYFVLKYDPAMLFSCFVRLPRFSSLGKLKRCSSLFKASVNAFTVSVPCVITFWKKNFNDRRIYKTGNRFKAQNTLFFSIRSLTNNSMVLLYFFPSFFLFFYFFYGTLVSVSWQALISF